MDKEYSGEELIIIDHLKVSEDLKKIEKIPYGFTMNEDQAKDYCNNYTPFQWRRGNVDEVIKYDLDCCIIQYPDDKKN